MSDGNFEINMKGLLKRMLKNEFAQFFYGSRKTVVCE